MKKFKELLIILLVTIPVFWNCNKAEELSIIELEQTAFYQVFPSVIDSIYYDFRLIAPPPPPPDFLQKRGYDVKSDFKKAYADWEKSNESKKMKAEWEKKRDSIKRDTTSIFLTVPDSLIWFDKEDMFELINHFKNHNLSIVSENINLEKGLRIDINKLKVSNDKLKFKYQSEFPKGREFWKRTYGFNLDASIGFSRILFDKNNSFGVFNVGLSRGPLNGNGYRVFIKKNEFGIWVIDKIEGTWIS